MAKNQIVIIPTFNELNSLKKIINLCPKNWKLFVIDDCSNDRTVHWLKKNKIQHIKNNINLGYEKSILKGLNYAIKVKNIKFIATLDSDGEHNPKYLNKMKKKMIDNKLDMIVAERSKYNRISELIIGKIYKKKFEIPDPLSGFKVYKKESLSLIFNKIKPYFFLVDIINLIHRNSGKIGCMKITSRKRYEGNPKVGSNIFVNIKILFIVILFIYY